MIESFKKVLVLAPHTDDGELGAGGTISKLVENGSIVYYAAFSSAEESVPEGFPKDILKDEVYEATSKLGIKRENVFLYNYKVRRLNYQRQDILEDLIVLRNEIKPDLVLTPSLNDVHQDHNTIAQESLRAFKKVSIFAYELVWNIMNFSNTCMVSLDKSHISKKVDSINSYKSQQNKNYTDSDFIFSLAKIRGVQVDCEYAESFELLRLVLK